MDRNKRAAVFKPPPFESLSARRAWIEIPIIGVVNLHAYVALRKESVDRNPLFVSPSAPESVALRKESVDRNNAIRNICAPRCKVALRKESVDRNDGLPEIDTLKLGSLSARRAWIEICVGFTPV